MSDEARPIDEVRGRFGKVHWKAFQHQEEDDGESEFSFRSQSEHFEKLKKKAASVGRKRHGLPPPKEEYIKN